jgi:hypothetical protein
VVWFSTCAKVLAVIFPSHTNFLWSSTNALCRMVRPHWRRWTHCSCERTTRTFRHDLTQVRYVQVLGDVGQGVMGQGALNPHRCCQRRRWVWAARFRELDTLSTTPNTSVRNTEFRRIFG